MPSANLYHTVKQQALSFTRLANTRVSFATEGIWSNAAPIVHITHRGKQYKFSDPDWNVVSKQLNKLYFVIKDKNDQSNISKIR